MSEKPENTTYNQLTLLSADSLANLTVRPGSRKARQMTVTSGRNIAATLPNSNPFMSLLKMCLESDKLYSMACYLTWSVLRTPSGRLVYRLRPSVRRTSEKEYSLWPTPTSSDKNGTGHVNNGGGMNLRTAVQLWPTPRATDGSKGTRTKTGALRELERGRNRDLGMMVKLYPTPTAMNATGGAALCKWGGSGARKKLKTLVSPEELNGSLNPEFVEWLMGFPIGWTDLGHSEMP